MFFLRYVESADDNSLPPRNSVPPNANSSLVAKVVFAASTRRLRLWCHVRGRLERFTLTWKAVYSWTINSGSRSCVLSWEIPLSEQGILS